MIFNPETKGFQTISTHPDDNWTEDKTLLVIPDGSELAEKVIANFPYFECVFEGGILVDVTPAPRPPTPSVFTQEQVLAAAAGLSRIQARDMALNGTLSDNDVLEVAALFPYWVPGAFSIGDVCNHNGQVWQCVQAHDSGVNPSWTPETVPALWSPYHANNPAQARAWVKPTGAQDAYQKNEVMRWTDEKIYRSTMDANVHNPVEYARGWEAV